MYYCCVIVNYTELHCHEHAEMQGQRDDKKKKKTLVETILIRQSGENLLRFHGCHGYQSAARNVVVKWLWWQGCPHPAVRVTALCSSLCAFLSDVCAYDLTVWLILVG